MATPYTVGDTAPALTGTVSADLTGATVEVHVQRPDGTVFSRAGTVTTAPAPAAWSLQLVTGDLTLGGVYRVEVQATFSNGKIQTFAFDDAGSANTFTVRDQIG
jgi:hypothetical protein